VSDAVTATLLVILADLEFLYMCSKLFSLASCSGRQASDELCTMQGQPQGKLAKIFSFGLRSPVWGKMTT
jgi:hypothetical protein